MNPICGKTNWKLKQCLIALLILGNSCAEQGPSESLLETAPAKRFGLLTITYSDPPIAANQPTASVMVNGLFARHSGIEKDHIISMLNPAEAAAVTSHKLPLNQCRVIQRNLGNPKSDYDGVSFIDLLDAGDIRIHQLKHEKGLTRRTFPDIFPTVSGVTYEGVLSPLNIKRDMYRMTIQSKGSYDVGGFSTEIGAPAIPRLLELNNAPVTTDYASIDWDSELTLSWLTSAPLNNQARMLIEISLIEFDRSTSLQCAIADTGTSTISAKNIDTIQQELSQHTTVRLNIRRVHHTSFSAPGLHTGDVYFVSSDSVILR